jgi:hypothetical protein
METFLVIQPVYKDQSDNDITGTAPATLPPAFFFGRGIRTPPLPEKNILPASFKVLFLSCSGYPAMLEERR